MESSEFRSISHVQDPTPVAGDLLLYEGAMTLLPHQGKALPGAGSINLVCGGARRELRIRFRRSDGQPIGKLPPSADGRFGSGTSMMRVPLSSDFFVFVTSTSKGLLAGESQEISSDDDSKCNTFRLHLLNCILPSKDIDLAVEDWKFSLQRTAQAYDLTRVLLPAHEINLTHTITLTRNDGSAFSWKSIEQAVTRVLTFLSFANCSRVATPVCFGYAGSRLAFFRFETPSRTIPTNRRTWATDLPAEVFQEVLSKFLRQTHDKYWDEILKRAIGWQLLAERALFDSWSQSLSTTQMLLEMLAYVVLVEDKKVLSEDGYGKLPASDRIMLLCAQTQQLSDMPYAHFGKLKTFCASNSIANVGELIASIRNKLIHPTKKNRDYLSKVPSDARFAAIECGIQIASLSMLHAIGHNGKFFDTIDHVQKPVPWAT